MKRFSYSLYILIVGVFMLSIVTCGSTDPRVELTSHIQKIVSILKQNHDDADKAATAVKAYVSDNLNEIKSLVGQIREMDSSADAGTKLDVRMVFVQTHLIDSIDKLEKDDPGLMNSSKVEEALKPLFEVFK
ncbi:MAG: hypothetical protein P8107_07040 [Spirochaetia bacterium]